MRDLFAEINSEPASSPGAAVTPAEPVDFKPDPLNIEGVRAANRHSNPFEVAESMLKTQEQAGYTVLAAEPRPPLFADIPPAPTAVSIQPMEFVIIVVGFLVVFFTAWSAWRWRKRIFTRKTLFLVAVLLFLLTAIFPPWRITTQDRNGHTLETRVQISWLFEDPSQPYEQRYGRAHSARIATDIISLEFLCLAAVTLTGHFLQPRPRRL